MDDKIEEIIARHLSGTATAEEQGWLDQWRQSASNEAQFREYEAIWQLAARHADGPNANPKRAWAQFESLHLKKTVPRIWGTMIMRAAAVILLGLMVIALYHQVGKPVQYVVASGETVKELILPDSSHVWLAANSSLSYPESFSNKSRVVSLNGKAFFDITRNEDAPFIIESGSERVRVLGTSFSVDTNDEGTKVIVATGSVQLYAQEDDQSLRLSPGEVGSWNRQLVKFYHSQNEDKNFMSWATGRFDFEDTNLREVLVKLNEFYPDSIETELNIASCSLTATFNNQPLSEVMEELSIALGLKYKKTNSGYLITETACTSR